MESPNYPAQNTSRKEMLAFPLEKVDETFSFWIAYYLRMVITGVRSEEVAKKIELHLTRFQAFFETRYGHERISACVKRDMLAFQTFLWEEQGMAAATVNNHLAHLSGFTTWVRSQSPQTFPLGDPCKGISELGLPPLEPRTLSEDQVRSLKNVCDRLPMLHALKGRKWARAGEGALPKHQLSRPLRDRALVFVLLSTGLRREELVNLNLDQVLPHSSEELRAARKAKIERVLGKGKTERSVFLSKDARAALADYLEQERPQDLTQDTVALFLSASQVPERAPDGRLSPRAVNLILEQIGRWHDAEVKDDSRKISPLRPHDLRHTFAFSLAAATGADAYELERRLGHRSQRYIARYTNPPEEVAASYVEKL